MQMGRGSVGRGNNRQKDVSRMMRQKQLIKGAKLQADQAFSQKTAFTPGGWNKTSPTPGLPK